MAATAGALPGPGRRAGRAATPSETWPPRCSGCPPIPLDARWFEAIRRQLLAARDRRPQPGRDDIVVLRSNGLVIAALAEAGALPAEGLDRAAAAAADHLFPVHRVDGRWFRSSRDGRVGPGRAVLADLGDLASGLLALYQATGEVRWLNQATGVIDTSSSTSPTEVRTVGRPGSSTPPTTPAP